MENINYIYVDEETINPLLICQVCQRPYVNPVVTQNHDRCCRLCIPKLVNVEFAGSFSQFLVQVDEGTLRALLDDLRVKCLACETTNLRRGDFPEHLLNQCSKRTVSCTASDLNCPWTGSYEESAEHTEKCLFEYLRPALSIRTSTDSNGLEEYRRIVKEQQNEIQRLRQQIEGFQKDLQHSIDINNDQNTHLEDIHKDMEAIRAYLTGDDIRQNELKQLKDQYHELDKFVQEIQDSHRETIQQHNEDRRLESIQQQRELDEVRELCQQVTNLVEQMQQSHRVLIEQNNQFNHEENLRLQNQIEQFKDQCQKSLTASIDRNQTTDQLDHIHRQMNERLAQNEVQIKKYQEQYGKQVQVIQKEESLRKNELLRLRQLSDQHEIQIRLLARKKCVVPSRKFLFHEYLSSHSLLGSNPMINSSLQAFLANYPLNADINLDGKDCDNEEVEYICKVAIGEKRCRKLRLENNKITGKGAASLADALYANNILTEIHLSNNPIGDIGAHALAQVLSIHNWTLTWLEINAASITDDGVQHLAEMLKVNKSVILLGLSFNQISDRGVASLTAAIGYFNENLQWLHLASNRKITDGCVPALIDMFGHNRSLQAVYINDCSLSNNAVKDLKNAIRTKANFFLEI